MFPPCLASPRLALPFLSVSCSFRFPHVSPFVKKPESQVASVSLAFHAPTAFFLPARNLQETSAVYVGNGSGDVVVAYLSAAELAELSGDANGPVPCQRRANHNPYRAVRVELTQQAAKISLQVACRAQRKAAARAGAQEGAPASRPRWAQAVGRFSAGQWFPRPRNGVVPAYEPL